MYNRHPLPIPSLQILEGGHAIVILHDFQKILQATAQSMKRKNGHQVGTPSKKDVFLWEIQFSFFFHIHVGPPPYPAPPSMSTSHSSPLLENQVPPNRIGVSLRKMFGTGTQLRRLERWNYLTLPRKNSRITSTKFENVFEQFETRCFFKTK